MPGDSLVSSDVSTGDATFTMRHRHRRPHSSIFVVDDDSVFLEIFSRVLTRRVPDVKLSTFECPDAMLERLDRERPETIVTDLYMKRADGFAVLHQVKRRASDVPVVVVSGLLDLSTADELLRHGAFEVVPKTADGQLCAGALNAARRVNRLRRTVHATRLRLERRRLRLQALEEIVSNAEGRPVKISDPLLAERIMKVQRLTRTTLQALKCSLEVRRGAISLYETMLQQAEEQLTHECAQARRRSLRRLLL